MKKAKLSKRLFLFLIVAIIIFSVSACGGDGKTVKLDPKNPVTISVWHYYNGAILNAFDALLKEFNETVGTEKGIIVESNGMGNVSELEKAVISSANKEVGSKDMPNIFASYADTAYAAEKMDLLANLDDYFTEEEQATYLESYIEEGKIGQSGELRIFPIAKSTETLMVNETDWLPFAEENSLSYDDLTTMEGMARVAELYYDWTDAQTPDVQNDGKAFFGRDVMANFFIISSRELGTEIFQVEGGVCTMNVDEAIMRRIWDYYYVPFISGYFTAYGRFRSDDAKLGDILAYVGSTASASYFPTEVTSGERVYPVVAKVLPVPHFEGAESVIVQQGAGMVVTKGTPQEEYASALFLKWFTEVENNIEFSALSGYMPVKREANDYDVYMGTLEKKGITLDAVTEDTLMTAFDSVNTSEMYTNKAFDGGAAARAVLENNLQEKVLADREAVLAAINGGSSLADAVAEFNTDENFQSWLFDFRSALNAAIS